MFCVILICFIYTFEHIWTNLLTQCTPMPVPIFCCFSISGFPHIESVRKIPGKIQEKPAYRKLREKPERGQRGARGAQAATRRGPTPGRARRAPGAPGPPLAAPFAYLFSVTGKLQRKNPISQTLLCSAAAALPRSGAPEDLFPAPCRRED